MDALRPTTKQLAGISSAFLTTTLAPVVPAFHFVLKSLELQQESDELILLQNYSSTINNLGVYRA